jgi:hypothetical protein
MKKSIYFLLFLSLAAFQLKAQDTKEAPQTAPAAAPAAVNPNAAEITFESELHDYGTIKQGADGNYDFKFTNTGNEALIISNAKGSCGCTVPTYPKEPIKKGQSAIIKVKYDTNRIGAFSKTVTITSNAKTASKVITIKGNVEAAPKEQTTPFKKVEDGGTPFENAQKSF